MAGRPKRRALLAQQSGEQAPEEPDWAGEAARMMGLDPALVDRGGPPDASREALNRETQQVDRRSLAEWFRDQVAALEQDHQERMDELAQAGEHPSPLFAGQVRRFSAIGMPPDVLAYMLGISEATLHEHYEAECRVGEGMFLAPVFANLYRIATSGNDRVAVKAATEIANRRGGEPWRPPAQKLEIDDDRKKSTKGIIDSSKLSWEEREQLRAIIERQIGMRASTELLTGGVAVDRVIESGDGD